MEDMSEEEGDMKDSLFNRDDDDFTGIGTKGAGSN